MPARKRRRKVRHEAIASGAARFEPRAPCAGERRGPAAPVPEPTNAAGPPVRLDADELEALRLADLLGLYQAQGAQEMGVSRATFGRVVAAARKKVATALVQGRPLVLPRSGDAASENESAESAESARAAKLDHPRVQRAERGDVPMTTEDRRATRRVGVALDAHGNIARHFGHSVACRVYEIGQGGVRVVEDRARPGGAGRGGRHAHSQQAPGHGPAHGGGDGPRDGHGPGRGGGNGRWIADVFAGCGVVVTAGLGAGAKRNLQALGARVVVTDHPRDPDAAVELLALGKL